MRRTHEKLLEVRGVDQPRAHRRWIVCFVRAHSPIRYTADQLGHTDPKFTFRVYAQASKRRERLAPAQRKAFDEAIEWARMGTNADFAMPELAVAEVAQEAENDETPASARVSEGWS